MLPTSDDNPPEYRACDVGQREACGAPAVRIIAVAAIRATVWATDEKGGGVVFLCERHANTPATDWDA